MVLRISLGCALLLVSGCQLPQWRVGQAKVPAPIAKPAKQIEAERVAAKLIADRIETPVELVPVAAELSQSLGEPAKPIPSSVPVAQASEQALRALQASIVALQRQVAAQNRVLANYAGKPIEGTGFNLFGPATSLIVIGLIVLCVMFPPALTALWFVLRRTKAAATHVIDAIEEHSKEAPEAMAALKARISKSMAQDSPLNAVVAKIRDR